ncbi:MAG: GAF domain-containing sensor histidine kinase [Cyanobacteria bacterium]|nr:GAF domain-containing sensor histidine kinase [Cyanobacteriota bacterium]MDW8200591.1 GAF domain-containing protein [Cyanobacteriota bacterium SKYGB_h_bin112]
MLYWLQNTQRRSSTLRKVIDRIRSSLESEVVIQTAVNEVATLLDLDSCVFFCCDLINQHVRILHECSRVTEQSSIRKNYTIAELEGLAPSLLRQDLVASGVVLGADMWRAVVRWVSQLRRPQVPTVAYLFGFPSYLLIPVRQQQPNAIGYLACLVRRSRLWTVADIEFMQSVAQQLEIALHQARLYEQTQRQAQREHLVNQITTQTRQSFDLEIILTEAISQLLEALQADRCLVHLVEPLDPSPSSPSSRSSTAFRRKHLYETCREPFAPSIADFDTDGPITRWVIQHRQPVVIPDVANDPRIGVNNTEYQRAEIKSSLVIPVQANDTLYGILYLNQCSSTRYWSEFDQQLAHAVADQLAISIQQAHLYARTQQQAIASAAQAQRLAETLRELQATQARLIQSEKMSSLGQLVAGLAHEINNPISFIYGNVPYIKDYIHDLLRLLEAYRTAYPQPAATVQAVMDDIELDFILGDLSHIISSMAAGAERIRQIVKALRNFSRLDEVGSKVVDIHDGLESCLSLISQQLEGILVIRDYGNLPSVECYPGLLNQVFMGLLMNALEALQALDTDPKRLTLRTEAVSDSEGEQHRVRITIANSGPSIPPEVQSKMFDPFFTTKAVGQGSGLGLAISYQIVVNQHHGQLECHSEPGKDTEFIVEIPVKSKPSRHLTVLR